MSIDDLIRQTECELTLKAIDLGEWISAKCIIEKTIDELKAKKKEQEDFLRYLQQAKARGET